MNWSSSSFSKAKVMDQKNSNFKMFKVKKKWIFASAVMLSMLGAGGLSTGNAKADTVDSNTVKTSVTTEMDQSKASTDVADSNINSTSAVSSDASSSTATPDVETGPTSNTDETNAAVPTADANSDAKVNANTTNAVKKDETTVTNVVSAAETSTKEADAVVVERPTIDKVIDGDTIITGTGVPGNAITIEDGAGDPIGSGIISSAGDYSVTIIRPAIAGEALMATQTDINGNESKAIATVVKEGVTLPIVNDVKNGDTVVTGSGVEGNRVTIRDEDSTVLGSARVDHNGNYSITLSRPAAAGEALTATQTNADGEISGPVAIVVREAIPAPAPTLNDVIAGSKVVTGTGEAGDTVMIKDDAGNVLGSGTVGSDGTYSITLSREAVKDENLNATQIGDYDESNAVTVVVAPLTAPVNVTIDGIAGTITGTGVPGATILIYVSTGKQIGEGIVVDADGTFSYDSDEFVSGDNYMIAQKNGSVTSAPVLITAS